jgi:protein TonB
MTELNQKINKKAKVESLDEIVFQGRNKEYGAYLLRKRYNKYVIISFVIAFIILGGVVAKPLVEAYRLKGKALRKMEKNVTAELAKVNDDIPPPPPPPPPPSIEAQAKFKAPVVVDTVKEVKLASVEDLKEAATNEAPPEEIKVEEKKDQEIEKEEPVFLIVEENATFQGGDLNSFHNWVQQNIVYPQVAAENGLEGKVIVQFAVNSKGNVVDIKILRGLHPEVDKEVIRVLQSSPKWTPGKQGGKAVKQQFVVPIIFKLQ